ncbi:MAG: fibrobacter succinogenes major paralogous domain-containing protein [Bacteroidia bacterium]|nr:fibrobacter succinogenes major paralogous domain-containing protein [Bacteroidia bacterium]
MKKPIKIGHIATTIIFLLVFAYNCKKSQVSEVPLLVSLAVKNTAATTVDTGGNISSEGSSSIISRGVCWSVKQNPTIKFKDSTTVDGAGVGIFNSIISGLMLGSTYYIRAYATNGAGTGYGNQVSAIISATIPNVSTLAVSAISETDISSGGTVSRDGGSAVFARGVCWSTSKNPTTGDSFTSDGSGDGSFSSVVSNLTPDAVYYLRAYATNTIGTGYGTERTFSTGKLLVKDKDGNFYHFVSIGSQVWMTENLRSTRDRDSTTIPLADNSTTWSNQINPGYCWYNDDEIANKNRYGALYNWYAASSGKLCPTGWHVPSDAEWTTLSTFLGGESVAGGKLKEIGVLNWTVPNALASNLSGFTALPGGYRTDSGIYSNIGNYGNWWSTTPALTNVANYRYMYYGNGTITKSFVNLKYGLSVRCLKN